MKMGSPKKAGCLYKVQNAIARSYLDCAWFSERSSRVGSKPLLYRMEEVEVVLVVEVPPLLALVLPLAETRAT